MIIANALVKPIWIFAIDRNVQLAVGHQTYGLYTALLGLTVVFNILLDMGITNFNNREIANDKSKIHQALPNLLLLKLLFSIGYLLVIGTTAVILGYTKAALVLLLYLAIAQILSSYILYLRSNISANHDFKSDAFISILDKLLMIGACGYFLFFRKSSDSFSIQWFVWLQIAAYIVTIMVCFGFINRKYAVIDFSHFSITHTKSLLLESLPYALLVFFMGIFMRGDAILLERIGSAEQTGIFANAFRLLDMSNTLGVLFAGILLAMFSRMIANQANLSDLLSISVNVLMPIGVAVSVFCYIHSPSVMLLLYHDGSVYLSQVFAVLMLSFPAYCILYIYSTLLTANKSIGLLIKIALLGGGLSLLLNATLIPHYQALGTAISATVVLWVLAMAYLYFTYSIFAVKFKQQHLLRYALFILLFGTLNMALKYSTLGLFLIMGINLLAYVLLWFSLGFAGKKGLSYFLRQYI